MAILPQSAKSKGARWQREIRDMILDRWKNLTMDDVRSTSMGAKGEDVQLSSAARVCVPYQIEAKAKAQSQAHTYWKQAKAHGKHTPLVIVKQDRGVGLAMLEVNHFFDLLKELYDLRAATKVP